MSKHMKDLIFEYYKQGHSLARGIDIEELEILVNDFRMRLLDTEKQLDLSPESLANLSKRLLRYYQQAREEGHSFSDEENLQIVREIVAYMGGTILQNKRGQWDNPGGLLNIGINYSGNFEAVKDGHVKKYSSSVENLGYLAAGIWDGVLLGIEIDVRKFYDQFAQKRIKERLGTKKHHR